MKRKFLLLGILAMTVAIVLAPSCAKDDLLTSLSEVANPDATPVLESDDAMGLWAVSKKIGLYPDPEDD